MKMSITYILERERERERPLHLFPVPAKYVLYECMYSIMLLLHRSLVMVTTTTWYYSLKPKIIFPTLKTYLYSLGGLLYNNTSTRWYLFRQCKCKTAIVGFHISFEPDLVTLVVVTEDQTIIERLRQNQLLDPGTSIVMFSSRIVLSSLAMNL